LSTAEIASKVFYLGRHPFVTCHHRAHEIEPLSVLNGTNLTRWDDRNLAFFVLRNHLSWPSEHFQAFFVDEVCIEWASHRVKKLLLLRCVDCSTLGLHI